jgi:glycosyltransferase involved in cell wall biosynthesis
MSKIKILFFTSNFNRTGAEVVLFNFVTRLDPNHFDIGIIFLNEFGELVSELPNHIKCFKLKVNYNLFEKGLHYLGKDILLSQLKSIQKENNYSIWYINTIGPSYVLKYAHQFNVKTLSHIHELASNFSNVPKESFNDILHSDAIIACSELVMKEIGYVHRGPLKLIKSTIDTEYIDRLHLTDLQGDSDQITIVSSGSISERKGTDLFLFLANYLRDSKYRFIWLGNFSDTGYSLWIQQMISQMGITNVTFVTPENQLAYYTLIRKATIFLSTSREESLGLAMMESIYLNTPVIALNSGGSKLFINDSNGLLIDTFDVPKIAFEITRFIEKNSTSKLSENSKTLFIDYNLNKEFIRWQDLLQNFVL